MSAIVIDLYCRISKDYDGTLRSVEDQEAQGRAWVVEHAHLGYILGQVHRDHALSAWNPKVTRPSFLALMERLETGAAHGVWVRDLDRFTRKMEEGERLLKAANNGTMVASGHQGKHELTTARGKRNFREEMVDAAYESDRISERSTRGKLNKAKRGKSNASTRGFGRPGFGPVPKGWEPGDPREPVPAEQVARERAAVRDAAERILAGEYLNTIANEWNVVGLRTTRGGLWDGAILRQMLSKPSVAGLTVHKGVVVGVLHDGGEPVLDRATWDQLQSHFVSRKRGRPATEYLLSGIAKCGVCGNTLYGRPSPGAQPNTHPDGTPRRQYWCQTRPNCPDRCGKIRMDQRLADQFVTEAVLARLGDPRHAERLNQRAAKIEAAREGIVRELHRLDEDAKGIASKTATRGYGWVDAAMGPIDARRAKLTAELAKLTRPEGDADAALDLSVSWDKATLTQRRAMVRRAFPEGVRIGPANSRGRGSSTDRARIQFGQDRGSDREAS
jgi:site-specific DNA recombinase